ncbi:hypothetical protein B0O80DRAFT_457039 [Mortierella sp. GBAus27b]|nr:hypothetical protein BGX31_010265 [Mortierella sp. GBA43]KAI8351073.1 hypothetical protein B0O80DRAFT_457039 [Mortierella sp. GBAus27b]
MQVLSRVNQQEIINDEHQQQQQQQQQHDPRVSFQLPPDASSPLGTTFPTTPTTPGVLDEPIDPYYDSDNEATPLDEFHCNGITKETLLEGQTIKSGYLMKKGERLKIWKKKWFVLRSSKLAYYKDDKEYELLRIIDIRDLHRAAEVSVKHKTGTFVILTPRRTLTVQAQSVAEMKEWIQAINQTKTQFDFTVSTSDLDSYPGTIQSGQQPQLQEAALTFAGAKQGIQAGLATGPDVIVPRRQQHESLSLADPDLHEKREKSRQKGKEILKPPSPGLAHDSGNSNGNSSNLISILDRPNPLATPTTGVLRRGAQGLALITTGVQAMKINSPSSPRMEHVHSPSLPTDPVSSEQSLGGNGAVVPGTPASPGGYYSGNEFHGAGHDHYLSSGDEGDDPCIMEAGRLASKVNLPGSGIVTDEQLESKVVRQGYLLKFGNKYKTWRKKWFVLRGEQLTYYKNNKEYQPHGIIPLSTIIDCLQTDPVSKSKQFCLRIVTAKRSFVCCAPDEDTLLQWLDALHVECDRVAHETHQQEIAEHKAMQLQQYYSGPESAQDGHDGDGEDNVMHSNGNEDNNRNNVEPRKDVSKPLGRTARLKLNLHNSLPRVRTRSGDLGTPSTGSAGIGGSQIRKVLSLDSAASSPPTTPTKSSPTSNTPNTGSGPAVTFHLPTVPGMQPTLPAPSATATFSA